MLYQNLLEIKVRTTGIATTAFELLKTRLNDGFHCDKDYDDNPAARMQNDLILDGKMITLPKLSENDGYYLPKDAEVVISELLQYLAEHINEKNFSCENENYSDDDYSKLDAQYKKGVLEIHSVYYPRGYCEELYCEECQEIIVDLEEYEEDETYICPECEEPCDFSEQLPIVTHYKQNIAMKKKTKKQTVDNDESDSDEFADISQLKVIPNYHWERIGKLPKKKEVSFPKETRAWKDSEYVDCEFGNFIVRGLEEDIDHLLNQFPGYFEPSDKEPVVEGIFDLKGCAWDSSISKVLNLIKEVPSLMIAGFFEDLYQGRTMLFSSKSGYPYITGMDTVSYFDTESELNRPAMEIYPTQSMSAKFHHIQTGEPMELNYKFADYNISSDFEKFAFITYLDGVYYMLKKDTK